MKFAAVIFDMDGVIIDSERYWPTSDELLFERIIPNFDRKKKPETLGIGHLGVYQALVDAFDFSIPFAEFEKLRVAQAEKEVYTRAKLMPRFYQFIQSIRAQGMKTALGTSATMASVAVVFKQHGLLPLFDTVVTADDVNGIAKPNPDIFLKAAEKLGVTPDRCLVIEDADAGIEAGKRAGMTVYAFRNGLNNHQILNRADLIFQAFSEIVL